jgi:hypothetical protein
MQFLKSMPKAINDRVLEKYTMFNPAQRMQTFCNSQRLRRYSLLFQTRITRITLIKFV